MSNPPAIGMDPWGAELNAHLAQLESRIDALEARPEQVYSSFAWKFNAGTPPAAATEVRLNNVDASLATMIDFRKIDFDGADRTPIFQRLSAGSLIRINDWDNAAILHRFYVNAPATVDATNAQVQVTWDSGSGTLPTSGQAKVNVAFLVNLVL